MLTLCNKSDATNLPAAGGRTALGGVLAAGVEPALLFWPTVGLVGLVWRGLGGAGLLGFITVLVFGVAPLTGGEVEEAAIARTLTLADVAGLALTVLVVVDVTVPDTPMDTSVTVDDPPAAEGVDTVTEFVMLLLVVEPSPLAVTGALAADTGVAGKLSMFTSIPFRATCREPARCLCPLSSP